MPIASRIVFTTKTNILYTECFVFLLMMLRWTGQVSGDCINFHKIINLMVIEKKITYFTQ